MKHIRPFAIILTVFGCALLAAWYLKRSAIEPPRSSSPGRSSPKAPDGAVKLGADPPHALGNTDAPVMIEEFGDFECLPCALLHPVLKTVKAEFGARVVIVFRQFPIASLHPHALAAARAAEAAGRQGKFWEMHGLLYENQREWHEASDIAPIFEQFASRIGLDLGQFKRDVASETVDKRIALDRERGRWIGVNSTPTVFLNGREVPAESLTADKLKALIDSEAK
jgi:protein-disulfide isomerase